MDPAPFHAGMSVWSLAERFPGRPGSLQPQDAVLTEVLPTQLNPLHLSATLDPQGRWASANVKVPPP